MARGSKPVPVRRPRPPPRAVYKRYSRQPKAPRLYIKDILAWADEHFQRTGRWPSLTSGTVLAAPWDTWSRINDALRRGHRGCRPGNSLARLLNKYRGKPFYDRGRPAPRLYIKDILAWADDQFRRMGRWPKITSGVVPAAPWDTWARINEALVHGYRGCGPGNSLARLLHKYRGKPYYDRQRPKWTEQRILAAADAFHARTGRWPSQNSPGPVAEGMDDTWNGLSQALARGQRGLPGGSSLAQLLLHHRGVRRACHRLRLTIKQILAWADEHHARIGRWPSFGTGPVAGAPGESWNNIHSALENGGRGLPTGYTLSTLLAKYRSHRYLRNLPPLTEAQILAWADAHYRRHGDWPHHDEGRIPESDGETWSGVYSALSNGHRGHPGGDSLLKFLMRHGRVPWRPMNRHPPRHERLSIEKILAWADRFHRKHGRWPAGDSGPVEGARDETWKSIDLALRVGLRGFTERSSLALFLEKHRGLRHKHRRPRFTVENILAWADAWHRREGDWPTSGSGPIPESPGDTWCAVNVALTNGLRGLPGGSSLALLLEAERGVPHAQHRPRFTTKDILAWADASQQRTGRWPSTLSGPIPESPGDNWAIVDNALRTGVRGLPGGSSIALLLEARRGLRHRRHRPPLSPENILFWADAWQRRTGRWPTVSSGEIPESPGDNWNAMDTALRSGSRGLPGGDSLSRLLYRAGRLASPNVSGGARFRGRRVDGRPITERNIPQRRPRDAREANATRLA